VGRRELAQSLEAPLVALQAKGTHYGPGAQVSVLLRPTLPLLYLVAELPREKKREPKELRLAKHPAEVRCMATRLHQRRILQGHARVLPEEYAVGRPEVAQEAGPLAQVSNLEEAELHCQW